MVKVRGAVRQMLRKLLKHPDDIQSITRTTSAELKKIRRGQIAGDEPGEDEDKSPVGPNYNESKLPPHLAKFVDKKGNLTPDAAKRVAAGRKKDKPKYKIIDRTPKGYGPNEEDEMAIMSLDHKELPRKLKITQQGLDAFRQGRDEGFELDEAGRPRGAAHIENTRFWGFKR